MYGQCVRCIDSFFGEEDVAVAVEGRAESEIVAAQDQALQTKYHTTKILQTETDSKC
jgi:hypothetical protein